MTYEIILTPTSIGPDSFRSIVVPIVIHPKPQLILFSKSQVYQFRADNPQVQYPDLKWPLPTFTDFNPVTKETVFLPWPVNYDDSYDRLVMKAFKMPEVTLN